MPQPVRLDRIAPLAGDESDGRSQDGRAMPRPSLIGPCLLLGLLSGCAGLALVMMYAGAWFIG